MTTANSVRWIVMIGCILNLINPITGLIGYDCGGAATNITTLSLLEVGECNIPQPEVNVTKKYVQLLQINQYGSIHVLQCKVEIYRQIRRCGMHSHTMDVLNGEYSYIDSISYDMCRQLHRTGIIKIGRTEINGVRCNQTTSRPIVLAGDVGPDGSCQGVYYTDPYGSWGSVIVKGTVKISLRDYTTDVNVESNKVHLRSGTRCELNEGHCIDIDGGDTYWDPLPEDSCKTKRYGLLYEGYADQTEDLNGQFKQTIYSMSEGEIIFALTAKERTTICGYTLIRTEHPKLLIVEIEKGNPFVQKEVIAVNNLDIFAYVNSKFVYVEKHVRTQMKQMYRDILLQRCNLERQVLQNALTIARRSPDEFAYNVMKGPGYMALMAGEVAHIIKCIPVDVKISETKECYDQLPVYLGNHSYYFSPRTHILTKSGVQINCNRLVSPMYLLDGAWYSLGPNPVNAMPPNVIKPLTKPTWQYKNLNSLATSGIYTQKDLDELRDHIIFPAERQAILNSVARSISGQPTITQGGNIANLFDENAINKIIESTWDQTWGYLSAFGNVSAGVIGILLIFRGIKLIFDTLIHGYALHTVYGWSIYLIGAIWDSVTYLLLHLKKKPVPDVIPSKVPEKSENKMGETANPRRIDYQNLLPPGEGSSEYPFERVDFGFDPRLHELTEMHRIPRDPVTHALPEDGLPPRYNTNYMKKQITRPLSFVWAAGKPAAKNPEATTLPLPDKRRSKTIFYMDQLPSTSENTDKIYPELSKHPDENEEQPNAKNDSTLSRK